MSFVHILALLLAAILIGRLPRYRQWAMLVASVLAVFWLQPPEPLRGLAFWIPAGTVGLTAVAWLITSSPAGRSLWGALPTLGVLFLCLMAIQAAGLLKIALPAAQGAARVEYSLLIVAAMLAFVLGLYAWRGPSPVLLWLLAAAIIAGFVILKMPSLDASVAPRIAQALSTSAPDQALGPLTWLGYSYMAFRILHTIRDRQTGRLPAVSLREYVTYVCFFPAFTAGPIDRMERFVPELREPLFLRQADAIEAGRRVILGLFKKFVLADLLAAVSIDNALVAHVGSAMWLWIFLYAYALRIYLDFSGYTDVAIGIGMFMGIRLPENFRSPYLKPNLAQFWNSWHITLTEWFRAYVFNPLTRMLRSRTSSPPAWQIILVAQVVTMGLIGLWHGIGWGFVAWGLWHAFGLFVHNRWLAWSRNWAPPWLQSNPARRCAHVLGVVLTFHYVALGWLFFVLSSPMLAWNTLGRLFGAA